MRWYEESRSGGFIQPKPPTTLPRVSAVARVALALSEACIEKRFGRFYVVAPYRPVTSDDDPNVVSRLGRIPELVYLPEVWTCAEVEEWEHMTEWEQWARVGLRSGWVAEHTPVLPLGIVLPEDQNRSKRTPAAVDTYLALGRTAIALQQKHNNEICANLPELLIKLEQLYWTGENVCLVGSLLNQFVKSCESGAAA